MKIITLAVLLAAGGCGPVATYQFRIVDSKTREPLGAVSVTDIISGNVLGLRISHTETHDLGETNADGQIDVGPVLTAPWYEDYFEFRKRGYETLHCTAYPAEGSWRVSSSKPCPNSETLFEFNAPLIAGARTVLQMRRILVKPAISQPAP